MKVELTTEQAHAAATFRQFVDRHITPHAERFERDGEISEDVLGHMSELGYFGACVPAAQGGLGMDAITFGLLCQELGRTSASLLSVFTVHTIVCSVLQRWGTKEQRDRYLPRLARGTAKGAFALSEPDVGSDAGAVRTQASLVDGDYVINGRKTWTSAGASADIFLVFAHVDGAPTVFLVEREHPGLHTRPISDMAGFRAALLADVMLENCRVPSSHVVGRVGFGFSHVGTTALDHGRYCIAWGSVGLGQACLDASTAYAWKREQFGKRLGEHQLVRRKIADMYTDTSAGRMLCFRAGYLRDEGSADSIIETSLAKYFASRAAVRSALDAVHLHGANGCSERYPVARYLRDAKVMEIIEGSNEMQQLLLGAHALQGAEA